MCVERGRGEHVGKFPHPPSSNGWLYPAAKGGRLLAATILAADLSPNCIQQSAGLALHPGVSQRLTTCNSTVQVQCSGAATQSSSSSFSSSSSTVPFPMTRTRTTTRTRDSSGLRRFGRILMSPTLYSYNRALSRYPPVLERASPTRNSLKPVDRPLPHPYRLRYVTTDTKFDVVRLISNSLEIFPHKE